MGDPSTSSGSLNPHSVFSDLVRFLDDIAHPTCLQPNLRTSSPTSSTNVTDADAGVAVACLNCDGCRWAKRLDDMRKQVLYIESTLGKMSIFERDLGKRMEEILMLHEGAMDGRNLLAEPGFLELLGAVEQFKFQLPYTSLQELPAQQQGAGPSPEPPAGIPTPLRSRYEALTLEHKKCLWCCSAFDGAVKKRVLVNWWIGEGLIQVSSDPLGATSLEQEGERTLKMLEEEQFIAPLPERRTWRMEPSVRAFLRSESREGSFFDYGNNLAGEAILLTSDGQLGAADTRAVNEVKTVFNVNRSTIGSVEAKMVSYMESLQVLHIGRSQPKQQAQVRGLKSILERLSKMKKLRLLSLEGISSLGAVPESVCRLTRLVVLDLRACQALQSLPRGIGSLKNLRHLDLSGCHILARMPKGIGSLSSLEVLKGFVIGNAAPKWTACTLHDLPALKNLHKLSVVVSRSNFPDPRDMVDLASIGGLVKLKILWTPASRQQGRQDNARQPLNSPADTHVLQRLEKLDLWCAPAYAAPLLLAPHNYPTLKQLCVRGAEFQDLTNNKWPKVEMLRLLFLPNFYIKWEQLHNHIFPKLSYLQMHNCPKLHEFPQHCDQEGVWMLQ